MAVNKSKIRSPRQWQKWLMSGAIAGVRYESDPRGFGTIIFNRSTIGREVIAFSKKCGLVLPTVDDLKALAKLVDAQPPESSPDPQLETVPFAEHFHKEVHLRWIDHDWSNNVGFVAVMRD